MLSIARRVWLLMVCCCASLIAVAQYGTIKGTVTDTVIMMGKPMAVTSVSRVSDSVLVRFARSGKDGRFLLQQVPYGTYRLSISFPGYADYTDQVVLTQEKPNLDLGDIQLFNKSKYLKEVVISQFKGGVRLKGDTVEYAVDSFKTAPNASVEDLLKKLPGIQVDKNGKIVAQGKTVEKVLVDGEEFFGDDPTITTQNLQAEAIDKVQVFDKQSEEAAFTGIDDGEKAKTINLTLKEDFKKGYFGKLALAGAPNWWNNSGMINMFKGSRKFSLYGIMSNTGKTGLSWQEKNQYGGSSSEMMEGDGFVYFYSESDNNFSYNGEGLPASWSGGAHYSNKFLDNKGNVNVNYNFNKLNIEGSNNTITQTTLANGSIFNSSKENTLSSRWGHTVGGKVEIKTDSLSTLSLKVSGSHSDGKTGSAVLSETKNELGTVLNSSNRHNDATLQTNTATTNLTWKKKFKKTGRSLMAMGNFKYDEKESTGFLKANDIYNDSLGNLLTTNNVDQKKDILNHGNQYSVNLDYTEPLSKKLFLLAGYDMSYSTSQSFRKTFDRAPSGDYDNMNPLLSNDYEFTNRLHKGELGLKYASAKVTATLRAGVGNTRLLQHDRIANKDFILNYTNFYPSARVQIMRSQASRFNINYNGYTQQPTIQQLQPVVDNNNTLSIYLGNPGLTQQFIHSFNFSFSDYNFMSERNIWVSLYGNYTDNAISTSEFVDESGRRVTQPINVHNSYNSGAYGYYGKKIKKLNLYAGVNINGNLGRSLSKVNGADNQTINASLGVSPDLTYTKEKLLEISAGGEVKYDYATYSLNTQSNIGYFTFRPKADAKVELPWKLQLKTDWSYLMRQKVARFDNNRTVMLWNASISRKLLKKDALLVTFSANDMLNQNRGFDRITSPNQVMQRDYLAIARYFTLGVTWNFRGGPGKDLAGPNNDDDD